MYFDYLYVNDFTRIAQIFVHKDGAKRTYNICTGKSIDLLTLAKIINQVHGKNLPIEIKEEGLNNEYTGDNSLFLDEFGEFDFTPAEKAVRELYNWYKESSNIEFGPKLFEP
jgi:nucleoside-diphosphate-sugar epimerase